MTGARPCDVVRRGLAGAVFAAPRQASAGARLSRPVPRTNASCAWPSQRRPGDFPFGAVIVRDGEVMSTGRNLGKTNNDPTAHAEMVAIRRFVAVRPADELKGTTLYASGEPCPMCMGAIIWCGIGRVVFAASIDELATKIGQIMVTSRQVADAAPFATIAITSGVLAAEALALFPK